MLTRFTHLLQVLVDRAREHEVELRKLTPNLHAALAVIGTHGRTRGIAGVARALGLQDPDYAQEMVTRLEDMGLVHRVARDYQFYPHDKRSVGRMHSILLTREGAEALLEHQNIEATVVEKTLAGLPPEGARALLELLESLSTEVVESSGLATPDLEPYEDNRKNQMNAVAGSTVTAEPERDNMRRDEPRQRTTRPRNPR